MKLPRGCSTVWLCLAMGSKALAANVAIIDSGVDYKHEALSSHMWSNPDGSTTAGSTTYDNDTHGWNFAENNNEIIDYKHLGTFSPDCYKVFEVQGKILTGTATEEEKAWYKAKKSDETFLKELSKFGNFIHGTHVSGIASTGSTASDLIGIKLLPTETPGSMIKDLRAKHPEWLQQKGADNPLALLLLNMLAQRQGQLLFQVGQYTAAVDAHVANGSFGTSLAAVKPLLQQLLSQLLGQEPSEEELRDYGVFFINAVIKEANKFVEAAPNTLFVFAAGNDGTDNDADPVSPANVKLDNSITVAATQMNEKLASFSNYGASMVDVAAPGVIIQSTIPGNEYLPLSGTSMAAPYVTNVAAQVKDANPALTPAQIKRILMDTVDVKDWLQGKVKTSGIVNAERAVAAATSSKSINLDQAVAWARASVLDQKSASPRDSVEIDLIPVSLPSYF